MKQFYEIKTLSPLNGFRYLRWLLRILGVFCLAHGLGCTKDLPVYNLGVQIEHGSYVPARIAVLKCQMWPNGARFSNLALPNFTKDEFAELCKKFDQFVINAFTDQPFMRGLSPKSVEKNAVESKGENFLGLIDSLWAHKKEDCFMCTNAQTFYMLSIADRQNWRIWLNELSRATKNTDAILLPFILTGYKQNYMDRGVKVSQKSAEVILLLIDTNNAYLLWTGGRKTTVSNQSDDEVAPKTDAPEPTWELLNQRLFTEDLFKEFPGRQFY